MESGFGDQGTLGGAAELLVNRARAYKHGRGRKYWMVQYWTTNVHETRLIKKWFGGNYYRHGVGFVWVLASKRGLKLMLSKLTPYMSEESQLTKIEESH